MKKAVALIIVILVAIISIFLGFNYKDRYSPNTYYKIYLSNDYLGMIESIEDLYDYIDKQQNSVKEKYKVSKVSVPEDFHYQKVVTYDNTLTEISEIYNKLDVVAYSISNINLLDKIKPIGKIQRYVLIMTDSFNNYDA